MTKLAASCLAMAALIAVAAALVASPLLVWGQHTAPALQWVKQHASQQLMNVQQLAQWPASLLTQQRSCVCPTSPPAAVEQQDAEGVLQLTGSITSVSKAVTGVGPCQLSGRICDCSCDYAAVERVNAEHLHPLLSSLVKLPFFRYFKVSLWCDCPFWPDDSMCMLRDCSVCECPEDEVPTSWRDEEGSCASDALEAEAAVKRMGNSTMQQQLLSIRGWRGFNNPWMPEADKDVDYSYINLLDNPERYTGYKGEHANRVWNAIYSQSCFSNISHPDTCEEQRVLYRLISGMHSSISAHIADEYLLDEQAGVWGPDLALFQQRLGNREASARIENLYFTYLFVLRAFMKAGPLLSSAQYTTGCPQQDAEAAGVMQQLVANQALQEACPVPFDEGRLWKGADAPALKHQLQQHFQNITQVMDCVGCEKCKLWGKLQILGIATSMKVLFSAEGCDGSQTEAPTLVLERNEVIAIVNLLQRLSHSIEVVRKLSKRLEDNPAGQTYGSVAGLTGSSLHALLTSDS